MSRRLQCCAEVWPHLQRPHLCRKPGRVERDGKIYCTIHDPRRVQEKREARRAEWLRELARREQGFADTRLGRAVRELVTTAWPQLAERTHGQSVNEAVIERVRLLIYKYAIKESA